MWVNPIILLQEYLKISAFFPTWTIICGSRANLHAWRLGRMVGGRLSTGTTARPAHVTGGSFRGFQLKLLVSVKIKLITE